MIYHLLWLVPTIPLAGFLLLVLFGSSLSRRGAAFIGVGSVGVAAILALMLDINYLVAPPPEGIYTQSLWTWIRVENFTPDISFRLDALSVVMIFVVTFVGFFIHLYSAGYMFHDKGYSRFFAYMNLFVGSMLILVLAANLLVLYLGWEGVGLCSYLLIGFWYHDPANGRAAMKAFIITRIGDVGLLIGLLLLFTHFGTLQIQAILTQAPLRWAMGAGIASAAAALLLAGAVGKSAQLPLQTWLPDAMAGPTPVSALIHAATMVTAGVYLIARMHAIFSLAPAVMTLVAIIGAATLLLAACSALVQTDIKRVLAYSTMSQIGYMFLALGVGAWSAAIFHFMTHAFFKSLLFLAAGVVIHNLKEEHNMFKMGGLRKSVPLAYWTFLIGSLSLTAFPLITAGFYSKDLILYAAFTSARGSIWLWLAGWIGAVLTGLYIFRAVFLTFFGVEQRKPEQHAGATMRVPLVVLATFAVIAGFIELPRTLGNHPWFTTFVERLLPGSPIVNSSSSSYVGLQIASVIASLGGILLAYLLFARKRSVVRQVEQTPVGAAVARFWLQDWGFDWLYDHLFVRPYIWLAHLNHGDIFDAIYAGIAWLSLVLNGLFSTLQTGRLRWYAAGVLIGAVIVIAIAVFV